MSPIKLKEISGLAARMYQSLGAKVHEGQLAREILFTAMALSRLSNYMDLEEIPELPMPEPVTLLPEEYERVYARLKAFIEEGE